MRLLQKELEFTSSAENICLVEKFIEEICDAYYISNTYLGNVLLAIEEAVKNAIVHGNGSDRKKKVKIVFTSKPAGLNFSISDEGNGFDFHSAPNPVTADESAGECTGRGLFLIRTLADEISFNRKGNKIEMLFRISSINNDTSIKRIDELTKYFESKKNPVSKGE